MRQPVPTLRFIVVGALLAAAAAGFAVQGWPGIFLFPLALLVTVVGLVMTRFVVGVALLFHRHRTVVNDIRARVAGLSTDELRAIGALPAHPEFAFAVAALARRGVEVKPERDALLDMLASPDDGTRGKGIAFLTAYYPEVHLPSGWSSIDPPEIWSERVGAIRAAS